MSDYENEDECWSALEGFRVKLISVIDPSRITPYLRQCKVLNPDDEEQVLSDPNLVIRKRKVGQCAPAPPRTAQAAGKARWQVGSTWSPAQARACSGCPLRGPSQASLGCRRAPGHPAADRS